MIFILVEPGGSLDDITSHLDKFENGDDCEKERQLRFGREAPEDPYDASVARCMFFDKRPRPGSGFDR
jgi:hypothetical protein